MSPDDLVSLARGGTRNATPGLINMAHQMEPGLARALVRLCQWTL